MKRLQNIFWLILLSTITLLATPSQLKKELLGTEPYKLKNQSILNNFYLNRNYQALWLKSNDALKRYKIQSFLKYVRNDLTVHPKGYLFRESEILTKLFKSQMTQKKAVHLELRLTSLYYEFLQHTAYGEIDWAKFNKRLKSLKAQKINADWEQYPRHFDVIELMSRENVIATIKEITPKGYRYGKLLKVLHKLFVIRYRGGWPTVPYVKSLKMGNYHKAIPILRKRLKLSGDYQACSIQSNAKSTHFDACLKRAVVKFQKRHNLKADGVVGWGTRVALNKTVSQEIDMVLLNVDRIKWLPQENSQRYIVVNIPEFLLHYIEHQQEVQTLKVIVGKTDHPTPVFSNKISYIVLNPYWKVPMSIVHKEIAPAMLTNPNYIRSHGLEAHATWEENSSIVALNNINWSNYLEGGEEFPYRFMQPPGPRNALGKIKFKFPNKFSVYLHDTPTKRLFNRKIRAFSHGCVRLHNPISLLESIARFDQNIDLFHAKNILKNKKKKQLVMDSKIPIHLIYLTTGVNAEGALIFRKDIYNYDKYQTRFIR